MKKTLKAMVSVLMAAVISVTSLCIMASAVKNGDTCVDSEGRDSVYYDGIWYYKPVDGVWYDGVWYAAQGDDEPLERNYTLSPMTVNVPVAERKPVTTHGITFKNTTLDWAKPLNLPVKRSGERYTCMWKGDVSAFPFTGDEELILRNALCRVESIDEYNAAHATDMTSLTPDDVLAYFEYSTFSPKESKYIEKFNYEEKWHYNRKIFLVDDYYNRYYTAPNIVDAIYYAEHYAGYSRKQVESMYKNRAINYLMSMGVPKKEATKYWDRSILYYCDVPYGVNVSERISSMSKNMVYFDQAGRVFTKKDVINRNLPTGAINTISDNAKKILKANPALEKLAILCKKYDENCDDFTLTSAESKKLKSFFKTVKGYDASGVAEYDIKGTTRLERNSVIQMLYYTYPNMTAAQKKKLNTYLAVIIKRAGFSTSLANEYPPVIYYQGLIYDIDTVFDDSDNYVVIGADGKPLKRSEQTTADNHTPTANDVTDKEIEQIEKVDKKIAEVETLLIQVGEGLDSGTVEMTSAQYSSLKALYNRVGFTPSADIKYSKNTKLALIQKFMDALPTMTSAQLSSLKTQLKAILA